MREARGFTLIELLIVIGIIAILAAILTPNIANARTRAVQSAAQSYSRDMLTALESVQSADTRIDYRQSAIVATKALVVNGIVQTLTMQDANGNDVALNVVLTDYAKAPGNGVSDVRLGYDAINGHLLLCTTQSAAGKWYKTTYNVDTATMKVLSTGAVEDIACP